MKAKLLLLCIVAIVSIAAYYPGETVQVQINMVNVVDVAGVQFTLCDIPDYLALISYRDSEDNLIYRAEATTRTLGFSVGGNEVGGCVRVAIFSMAGNVIPAGIGSIVRLHFDVIGEAPPGDVALNLSECIVGNVDSGPLPVTPINGVLTIVPTPTPTATPTPIPTPVEPVKLEVIVVP